MVAKSLATFEQHGLTEEIRTKRSHIGLSGCKVTPPRNHSTKYKLYTDADSKTV